MKIEVNKIEIKNEKDLEKFLKQIFNKTTEDNEEEKKKCDLYIEIKNTAEQMKELLYEIVVEDEETIEELEEILKAQKNMVNTYREILENRKKH